MGTGRVIDETFAGLASPRRSFSLGRPDLASGDRPGPFLVALVSSMTRDGRLDLGSNGDDGMSMDAYARRPADGPRPDYRSARYLDDDGPELAA